MGYLSIQKPVRESGLSEVFTKLCIVKLHMQFVVKLHKSAAFKLPLGQMSSLLSCLISKRVDGEDMNLIPFRCLSYIIK